jgi:hypothetical protein
LVKPVHRVVLPAALAILFASAFFTPRLISREDAANVEALATPRAERDATRPPVEDARDGGGSSELSEGFTEGFTDLYGNEVNDAIATYSFDHAGSLYELHSPQTELPKLGSPKS